MRGTPGSVQARAGQELRWSAGICSENVPASIYFVSLNIKHFRKVQAMLLTFLVKIDL